MEDRSMVGELAGIRLASGAATTVGKVRRVNEDSFLQQLGAYVVADGMGGHRAGDVASALVVETTEGALREGIVSVGSLASIVSSANAAVRERGEATDRLGMGSTLVGLFVALNADDTALVVVNVGDSRCYVLSGDELRQVSTDHSHVQELVNAGRLSSEDAKHHPERNVVTRAIGVDVAVVGDYFMLPSDSSMRVLLCSDGVSGEVDEADIAQVLRDIVDPQEAADGLIAKVMNGRAADNATAIVVDVAPVRSPARVVEHLPDDTQPTALLTTAPRQPRSPQWDPPTMSGDDVPAPTTAGMIAEVPGLTATNDEVHMPQSPLIEGLPDV